MSSVVLLPDHMAALFHLDPNILDNAKGILGGRRIRGQMGIRFHRRVLPRLFNMKIVDFPMDVMAEARSVSEMIRDRKASIKQEREKYSLSDLQTIDGYIPNGIHKPLKHQITMYNCIARTDSCAILADPGTCKTAPYLWAIDSRIKKCKIRRALVVTLSHLKKNVVAEARDQAPDLRCIAIDGKAHMNKVVNKLYKKLEKNIGYDVFVTNYESMFSLVDVFPDDYFDMVVLDEAHRIGSPTSRQTDYIIDKFYTTKLKYIVTGTLHANDRKSFYMPFLFMGPDTVPQANYYEFRKHHFYTVDPDGHIWVPMSGTGALVEDLVGRISVCFKKSECIKLPPIVREVVKCHMSGDQLKAYESAYDDMVVEIQNMCLKCNKKDSCSNPEACTDNLTLKSALTQVIKLSQITSGFYRNTRVEINEDGDEVDASNYIAFDSNPKLRLLMSTLNDIPEDKKVIIWCNHIPALKKIAQEIENAYGPKSYLTIYGNADAFDVVEKFKDPSITYLIANPAKAATGLNIQFSNYRIFFSCDYSFIKYDQAESRQDRQGQRESVTSIYLGCIDSIDESILETINEKAELGYMLNRLARPKEKSDG